MWCHLLLVGEILWEIIILPVGLLVEISTQILLNFGIWPIGSCMFWKWPLCISTLLTIFFIHCFTIELFFLCKSLLKFHAKMWLGCKKCILSYGTDRILFFSLCFWLLHFKNLIYQCSKTNTLVVGIVKFFYSHTLSTTDASDPMRQKQIEPIVIWMQHNKSRNWCPYIWLTPNACDTSDTKNK